MGKVTFEGFEVESGRVTWGGGVVDHWSELAPGRGQGYQNRMIADLAREVARLRESLVSVQAAVISLRNEKIVADMEKQAADHVKKTAKPKPAPRPIGRKLAVVKAPEVCPHRDFVIDRRHYVCLHGGAGGQRCRFNNEFPASCPLPNAE